jgi:hypothetical protein
LIGRSAEGSTVCVLIRRLNSSCSLSIAFDVRIDFHWLIGKRVKVKSCWWIRRASNCLEDFFAKPPSREERAHDLATESNPNTACSKQSANVLPATVVYDLHAKVQALNAELPAGYMIVPGGRPQRRKTSTRLQESEQCRGAGEEDECANNR